MSYTLRVKGMHCDACKALISMEIEELGFADKLQSVELTGEDMGEVNIDLNSVEDLEKVKKSINELGKYEVV